MSKQSRELARVADLKVHMERLYELGKLGKIGLYIEYYRKSDRHRYTYKVEVNFEHSGTKYFLTTNRVNKEFVDNIKYLLKID